MNHLRQCVAIAMSQDTKKKDETTTPSENTAPESVDISALPDPGKKFDRMEAPVDWRRRHLQSDKKADQD